MKLAALFSDHAIFQREIPIPVWGWTQPQVEVNARLGAVAATTRSAADGHFLLRMPALPAGGPYELKVTAAGKTVKAKDVWVGEVWVASGQSNMEWTLSVCDQQGADAIRGAAKSPIRMITIPRLALAGRQSDVEAQWQVASPETAGNFSAVAYHFARKLHDALKIPIGVINASWGGTIVETWTSREALIQNPDTRAWTERYEASVHAPEFWTNAAAPVGASYPADPGIRKESKGWAKSDYPDSDWATIELPQTWQAAGHNYSGVFWFRLSVNVPAAWAGQELTLRIGAVDKQDMTYFNGKKVGATGRGLEELHWNEPRKYRVPGKLVQAGRNVIAVRAYSFVYGGGLIGPAIQMSLHRADGEGEAISLAGAWRYREERNFGLVPAPGGCPMGPGNPNSPYMLYDNMIHPIVPYGIRGAIWYQGESNAGNAGQYQGMLTSLIRDWRRAWGQGTFPFLQVQLANFMQVSHYQGASDWARLREAQLRTCSEPETGMAVAIDIGEAIDVHPKNKKDVGERLAQWALVKTFGRPGVASGPIYSGMSIEGKEIRLRFENCGSGLMARGESLSHFVIAGLDRRFVPATARIEGSTVLVSSDQVAEPMAVRYAWADNPDGCNLYSREGLPASPFRTDTW